MALAMGPWEFMVETQVPGLSPSLPLRWPGLGWELQRREGEELSVSPALRGFTSVGPAAQGAASWTPCLQLSTLRQPSALCGSPTSASGAFASPL